MKIILKGDKSLIVIEPHQITIKADTIKLGDAKC